MRTILLFILLILVLSYSIAQKSVYIYANLAGGAFNEKKNFRVTEKPSGVSTPITSINSRLGGDIGIGFRLKNRLWMQLGVRDYYVSQRISIINPNATKQNIAFSYNIIEMPITAAYCFTSVFSKQNLYPYFSIGCVLNKYPKIEHKANLDIANKPSFSLLSYQSYKNTDEIMLKANVAVGLEKNLGKGIIEAKIYYTFNPLSQKLLTGIIDNTVYPNYPNYDVEYNTVASFKNFDNSLGISLGYKIPIWEKK